MREVPCEIIEDLLPLYHDEVCSEESRKMVDEHLAGCEQCRIKLARIQTDLSLPEKEHVDHSTDDRVIEKIAATWKKGRARSFTKGVLISALSISILILAYAGLFKWNIISVASDKAEISDISETADGKIVYYLDIDDGYRVNTLKYDMDDSGNLYITALRPVVKEESLPPYTLEKGHDFIDIHDQEDFRGQEVKAIYFGTPKDKTLIWKKGMKLPEASEEVKERFGF
ncbi:zf-HC2 domain-containing protein [Rossellomorea sp. AcN35-11]|nr:zf-HC2 domain-containing protein [Rossellomorea aquimaris]WJV29908.1 zf-HC2 domain-containing protein [Rossellomorea sp. AcN35-11]